MKMKQLIVILTLSAGSLSYAQTFVDNIEKPIPAQIFPNDPDRTQEDSDRNVREMKEYEERLEALGENPD